MKHKISDCGENAEFETPDPKGNEAYKDLFNSMNGMISKGYFTHDEARSYVKFFVYFDYWKRIKTK